MPIIIYRPIRLRHLATLGNCQKIVIGTCSSYIKKIGTTSGFDSLGKNLIAEIIIIAAKSWGWRHEFWFQVGFSAVEFIKNSHNHQEKSNIFLSSPRHKLLGAIYYFASSNGTPCFSQSPNNITACRKASLRPPFMIR